MAIKKYNQFVKTNEELVDAPSLGTKQEPSRPERGVETIPGRPITTPSTRPSRPSVVPGKRPSEEDAPLASNDEYIGTRKMKELVTKLGPDAKLENGTLYYDDKEINFYSETEMFHIGRKRFKEVEDVLDFLDVQEENKSVERDFEEMDPEFEAKSYRFTRKNKRLK